MKPEELLKIRQRNKTLMSWAEVLILALFVLLVYGDTLGYSFVEFDDQFVIKGNTSISDISSWSGLMTVLKPESRAGMHEWMPLKNLSLAIDRHFFKGAPEGYRPQALLWYFLSILAFHRFVLLLLRMLRERGRLKLDSKAIRICALGAALLFAAHPVHVHSAVWLSSRKDLLLGAFFFFGLLWQLKALDTYGKPRLKASSLALLFYILALLSKPAAVGFPVMVVALDFLFEGGRKNLRSRVAFYSVYFVVTAAFTAFYLNIAAGEFGHGLENVGLSVVYFDGGPLLLIPQQVWAYVVMSLWPLKLTHFPLYELSDSFSDLGVLMGGVSLLLLSASLCLGYRRFPVLFVCAVLFVAGLVPVIGQAPFNQYWAVRYLFISVAGPALLIAFLSIALLTASKVKLAGKLAGLALLFGSVVFWTLVTTHDIPAWSSTAALWQDALDKEPRQWVGNMKLAQIALKRGALETAIENSERCRMLEPRSEECISMTAMALYYLKRKEDAEKLLKDSMQYDKTGQISSNLATLYLKRGQRDQALKVYADSIEGRKVKAADLAHYAEFLAAAGEPKKAVEVYEKAQYIREKGSKSYAARIAELYRERLKNEQKAAYWDARKGQD